MDAVKRHCLDRVQGGMLNIGVLIHHLRKDGYSEEWIEEIVSALEMKNRVESLDQEIN